MHLKRHVFFLASSPIFWMYKYIEICGLPMQWRLAKRIPIQFWNHIFRSELQQWIVVTCHLSTFELAVMECNEEVDPQDPHCLFIFHWKVLKKDVLAINKCYELSSPCIWSLPDSYQIISVLMENVKLGFSPVHSHVEPTGQLLISSSAKPSRRSIHDWRWMFKVCYPTPFSQKSCFFQSNNSHCYKWD